MSNRPRRRDLLGLRRPRSFLLTSRVLRRASGLSAVGLVGLLFAGATIATAEPAAIEAKRAELSRIQAQLDAYNRQVEVAAEAYNGARYRLGQVRIRIDENGTLVRRNSRELASSREVLSTRLRRLYATPEPTLVQVLVSSGSLTAAVEQLDAIDLAGQQDARIVGRLRERRAALERLRRELLRDRAAAASAVAAREREKDTVERLLAERQAVLDSASAGLRSLLRQEEARRAREAAAAAATARRRQAAEERSAAAVTPPGGPEASGAPIGGAREAPPAAPAAGDGANGAAASYALQFLGVPYVWGGASPSGFDCSGLATYVFAEYGKSVPHYTGAIWSAFPRVSSDQLQRGDLVFFHGLGHMGIYLGGDQFVHAPHTGDVVKVSQFSSYSGYVGAVRP